jgi:transcription antitermination factor NusG
MPLLRREPDLSPDDVFQWSAERPWSVIRVRSRQEKVLARRLSNSGVGFYLPQQKKVHSGVKRVRVSYVPLFGGYIFVRGTSAQVALALRCDAAVSLVSVVDQQRLAEELQQIREVLLAGGTLVPAPDLHPGDEVTIAHGAFKGYRGIVLAERNEVRLVVSVTSLRASLIVEFGRDVLVPAPVRRVA